MSTEKLYLEADITLLEETAERKEAAAAIELPKGPDKQIDLQYFSAIFVSSGENLNKAFFLPSELVASEGTVVAKALDVEHKESEIIGHIYDRAFIDKDGQVLDVETLSSMDSRDLDKKEIHIVIAGIIYKNRFPEIAKEVEAGKWKVSMECYYENYDVKIDDLIMDRKEAESLGLLIQNNSVLGKTAKVIKNGIEVAKGEVARVLRNISFSGCGIVKNPANPPSVILETAKESEEEINKEIIILNYDNLNKSNNNVTSESIESSNFNESGTGDSNLDENNETSELEHNDTLGICVSYKKEVIDSTLKDERSKVIHTNWCALYEKSCTSFSRDTSDPKCLRNVVKSSTAKCVNSLLNTKEENDKLSDLVGGLNLAIDRANK